MKKLLIEAPPIATESHTRKKLAFFGRGRAMVIVSFDFEKI